MTTHEALGRYFVRPLGPLSRGGSARVTHALQMFTARVPGGTKCATARICWCEAPNFFTFTPPQAPCRPPWAFRTFRGAHTERGGGRRARALVL
eukprot:647984-Prymnesium_polylepis.1